MCILVMFIISWATALLTFLFFGLTFIYLLHRKSGTNFIFLNNLIFFKNYFLDVNWGSTAQSHCYRSALQHINKLEHLDDHVKNYKPQILVLSGNPAARPSLVEFAYSITKGNSLLLCGYIIPVIFSKQ